MLGILVAVSGMEDINVGETVCPIDHQEALPPLRIDEPTLQMTFLVNNYPFAGREGKCVTSRKIEERLNPQLQTDVIFTCRRYGFSRCMDCFWSWGVSFINFN